MKIGACARPSFYSEETEPHGLVNCDMDSQQRKKQKPCETARQLPHPNTQNLSPQRAEVKYLNTVALHLEQKSNECTNQCQFSIQDPVIFVP